MSLDRDAAPGACAERDNSFFFKVKDIKVQMTSLISLYGRMEREGCGYCNQGGAISWGIVSPRMDARHYLALMKLGWRRCGDYYYRPSNHKTCCPSYPIRLEVSKFQISKSQKKTLRVMKKYLAKQEKGPEQRVEDTGNNLGEQVDMKSSHTSDIAQVDSEKVASSSTVQTGSGNSSSGLTITLEKASCSGEKFELYKAYQVSVHGDEASELTEEKFSKFLVESSLVDAAEARSVSSSIEKPTSLSPTRSETEDKIADSAASIEWGTYHQLYRLNGKLIAVGVTDLLPDGFSSVYCFYDPNLPELSLGRFTAIKEIEFCKAMGYKYYYMGFYIHSCTKMRYKGEYKPSELLCHTTSEWFPLDQCVPLLEAYSFSPFEPNLAKQRAEIGFERRAVNGSGSDNLESFRTAFFDKGPLKPDDAVRLAVNCIPIKLGTQSVFVKDLTPGSKESLDRILKEWVNEVGPALAKELILKFR